MRSGTILLAILGAALAGGTGAAHGPRDMPVWGWQYSIKSAETHMDVPYSPEAFVRTRVLALTEYISRLQSK